MHPHQVVLQVSHLQLNHYTDHHFTRAALVYCTGGFQKYRTFYLHPTSLLYCLQVPGIRILYT